MITVTEYPVSLRWELKRLLEVFIKGGSLTATLDRLNDVEAEAVAILQAEEYCVNHKTCLPENVMTKKYIILNTGCETKTPLVYVLERPNFAARMFRFCELRNLCYGWLFTKEEK